jgi:hypothetical protein
MSLSVAQVTDGGLHRECFQYVAYRCVFVQDCQDFVGLFTTFPPARDAHLIDILTELTRTAQTVQIVVAEAACRALFRLRSLG